ncbi:hypothetical protein [Nocardia fusca]|uniref:hypothetical protein n=1 Tax=Nocardia fusca TaxID=941183 RepID=UPI0007A74C88|nr:hypothetical protein [Nocardia fusca]
MSDENTTYDYDLNVIGGGPVGKNATDYATQHKMGVAIVEAELNDGENSPLAHMPSKALLRNRNAIRAARRPDGARNAGTGRGTAKAYGIWQAELDADANLNVDVDVDDTMPISGTDWF